MLIYRPFLVCVCLLIVFDSCWAPEPKEILVVANRKARHSTALADYYMKKRDIPAANLIKLWVTDEEIVSREDYERNMATPVRRHLKDKDPFMFTRCLVLMYGVPLRVNKPKLTSEEKARLKKLQTEKAGLQNQIEKAKAEKKEKAKTLEAELAKVKEQIRSLRKVDQIASVDSEIALVLEDDYSLSGWLPNPYFVGYQGKQMEDLPRRVFMVSRLDGPSEKIVRSIIDDSLLVEEKGLQGKAYFDARWADPRDKKTKNYALYDRSIHRTANIVKKSNVMSVVLDDKQRLFQPGECPEAALYCGWYSLGRYVGAFDWKPGAVGYHIASAECRTLKRKKSQVWCKMMLEKGVAATLGPIGEPYVQAFPVPEVFFGLLIQGRLTLAECYAASNPFLSWKMVLIGDPLYRPFKKMRSVPVNNQRGNS